MACYICFVSFVLIGMNGISCQESTTPTLLSSAKSTAESTLETTLSKMTTTTSKAAMETTSEPSAGSTSEPTENPVSGATAEVSTTMAALTTTESPWPEQPSIKWTGSFSELCLCDLTAGRCDVNCCCDPDCSNPEDLKLFSRCWTPPASIFSRNYCSRKGLHAWNSTDQKTQRSEGGLLCIVTDNVPKLRLFHEKKPLTSQEMLQNLPAAFQNPLSTWKEDDIIPGALSSSYTAYYTEGSTLLTVDRRNQLETLKLPAALNSRRCLIHRPVRFLRSESNICRLKLEADCRPEGWSATDSFYRKIYVLRSPLIQRTNASEWNDTVVTITPRYCFNQSHCVTERPLPGSIRADDPSKGWQCLNVLKSLTYRIVFNGTQGIRRIYADFQFANVSSQQPDYSVHFRTVFHMLNESSDLQWTAQERSGNPGYLDAKPILIGRFSQSDNSSSPVGNHPLPWQLFPTCGADDGPQRIIRFGQNRLDFCRFRLQVGANRTDHCSGWHHWITRRLWGRPDDDQWLVAVVGNAQLTNPSHWIPVFVETSQLICLSQRVRAELLLIHSKFGPVEQPQQRLIGARLSLISSDPGHLCRSNEPCHVTLVSSVRFADASATPSTILPVPPSLKIRLPHDFFYPFRLLSSTAPTTASSLVCTALAVALSFTPHFLEPN